ncbi:cell division protein PerM, partial [Streptomyces sp. 12297]
VARPRNARALRAGSAGALTLLGGGALLVGASLMWHAGAAQESFLQLTGVWSGRFAVLLLALALIPNAAVFGAAYGLGPGFALGGSATATPLAFVGEPALPGFPLLAALPPEGSGTPLTWAAFGVPVLAGAVVGRFAVDAGAEDTRFRETALTAVSGALVCGLLTALAAAMAGGPMGSARLVAFGPVWWAVGGAACAWTLVVSVPVAMVVRAWRARGVREPLEPVGVEAAVSGVPGGPGGPGVGDWHDRGARELRWETLRRSSGTLFPDFRGLSSSPAGPKDVAGVVPVPVPVPGSVPGPVVLPVLPGAEAAPVPVPVPVPVAEPVAELAPGEPVAVAEAAPWMSVPAPVPVPVPVRGGGAGGGDGDADADGVGGRAGALEEALEGVRAEAGPVVGPEVGPGAGREFG